MTGSVHRGLTEIVANSAEILADPDLAEPLRRSLNAMRHAALAALGCPGFMEVVGKLDALAARRQPVGVGGASGHVADLRDASADTPLADGWTVGRRPVGHE